MKRYYSTKENWVNVEFCKFGWKFRIKILVCHLHPLYWYFAIFQNHTFILTSSRLSSTLEYSQRYPAFAWSNCICKNVHISTTTVHMATKLGGVVNYHKGLLFISYKTLWSRGFSQITWQTKAIISPLPHLAGSLP